VGGTGTMLHPWQLARACLRSAVDAVEMRKAIKTYHVTCARLTQVMIQVRGKAGEMLSGAPCTRPSKHGRRWNDGCRMWL